MAAVLVVGNIATRALYGVHCPCVNVRAVPGCSAEEVARMFGLDIDRAESLAGIAWDDIRDDFWLEAGALARSMWGVEVSVECDGEWLLVRGGKLVTGWDAGETQRWELFERVIVSRVRECAARDKLLGAVRDLILSTR